MGAEDSWPPFSDELGHGMSADIVTAAYASVGLEVEFVVRPYSRVLLEVRSGRLGAGFNVTRQASTEEVYIFGQEPILYAQASVFSTSSAERQYDSYDDIPDGKQFGLINGYEYGDAFEAQRHRFREQRLNTQVQIIAMMMAGRLDMAVMFDRVAAYTVTSMGVDPEALDKRFVNHQSAIYVAFSRKHARSQWWANKLDEGLGIIKQQGIYSSILARYQ